MTIPDTSSQLVLKQMTQKMANHQWVLAISSQTRIAIEETADH